LYHNIGTWLGITRNGRIAVLTNVRESATTAADSSRSRGAIVNSFLTTDPTRTIQEWLKQIADQDGSDNFSAVGGFSLLCGTIRNRDIGNGKTLAILSNRTNTTVLATDVDGSKTTHVNHEKHQERKGDDLYWLKSQNKLTVPLTLGLSNSLHHDPWPKVHVGLGDLESLIKMDTSSEDEPKLIEALFKILSKDNMPAVAKGSSIEAYYAALTQSVFIPKFVSSPPDASQHKPAKIYGTTQQSIILVDINGHVTYVERTLYDEKGKSMSPSTRDIKVNFQIEGWEST